MIDKLKITGAVLVCSMSAAVFAQDRAAVTGPYVGAAYGGFKARGGEFDDEQDFYELLAGWQITPYVGVEGNFADFGDFGNDAVSADVDGLGAALVGTLPLTDAFSLHAKVGEFWWDGDLEILGSDADFDDESPFYGLGARFMLTEAIGFTTEYKRYEIEYDSATPDFDDDDSDLDTLTVGVAFNF